MYVDFGEARFREMERDGRFTKLTKLRRRGHADKDSD